MYPVECLARAVAVDALQVKQRAARLGEGARERVDQTERILPLNRAEEIEHIGKDEHVNRQAEVGAGETAWLGRDDRQRESKHRLGGLGRDRLGDERARDPDLIHVVEGLPQLRRQAAGLPEPQPNRVALGEQLPALAARESEQVLGVEADDVRREEAVGSALFERMLLSMRYAVVGERPHGNPSAFEPGHEPSRRLALAELGAKEPDDVDAR